MPHHLRLMVLLGVIAALALTAFACGDDDDDNGSADPSPTPPTENGDANGDDNGDESTDPAPDGNGETTTGSLTLNGETLNFQVAFCGFSEEETGSAAIPFALVGSGTLDGGGPFAINAAIIDLSEQDEEMGEVHVVEVYDETTAEVLYTSAHAPEDDEFAIDGQDVSMTAEFSEGVESGESIGDGDFEATCPA